MVTYKRGDIIQWYRHDLLVCNLFLQTGIFNIGWPRGTRHSVQWGTDWGLSLKTSLLYCRDVRGVSGESLFGTHDAERHQSLCRLYASSYLKSLHLIHVQTFLIYNRFVIIVFLCAITFIIAEFADISYRLWTVFVFVTASACNS